MDEEFLDDEFSDYDFCDERMMYRNISAEGEDSCFAYPDPYEMDPADMMYLDEDGDLLEDL